MKFKDMPFSKKAVTYARVEAYAFTLILIGLVLMDKDVSAIAGVLIGVAWASYRGIQALYINMAKHEHLLDKKIEYKKLGLDSDVIDEELMDLESDEIINESYE